MKNWFGIALCMITVALALTSCQRGSGSSADASRTPSNSAAPGGDSGQRKILYYRNPMGQSDTSPTPKKDSMGMDYIPVYADEKP